MFTSVEALCQEFGLDNSRPSDELIRELARRRSLTHADKTGGAFASDQAKANFIRLSEAIEYLERPEPGELALAQTSEVRALARNLSSLQIAVDNLRTEKVVPSQAKSLIKSEISRSYLGVQISSGTLGSICLATLAFSGKISSNSMLAPIANHLAVRLGILALLVLSGIAFAFAWINEQRLKNLADYLLSDDGLATVIYWCVNDGREKEPKVAITRRMIVRNILDIGNPWEKSNVYKFFKRLFRVRVTHSFAQQTADAQLAELIARGVVRREGMKGIEQVYIIESERAEEIVSDRYEHYHPKQW